MNKGAELNEVSNNNDRLGVSSAAMMMHAWFNQDVCSRMWDIQARVASYEEAEIINVICL